MLSSYPNIKILVQSDSWNSINVFSVVNNCMNVISKPLKLKNKEFSIVFTENKTIQDLNFKYRNKNCATNVLSFPLHEKYGKLYLLGEIFLSYEAVSDGAVIQRKSFQNHLMHLLIHGILHLLGYDHHDETSSEMENLEIMFLSKLNIENPYY